MKKVYLLLIAVVVVSGCAPALQIGTSLSGDLAAHMLKSYHSNSAKSIVLGAQLESYRVGKYEVGISSGSYKNESGIIFMAYDQGMRTNFVYFEKNDPDDMKMINDFNQMGETAKKQQIRDWFIKYSKLDLGPIESETPKETTVSTPSSLPENIPTPVFAPDLIKPLQP